MISIILPVYNTEKYLERCINSIVNQSYNDLEIIIIDDGSTDGSARICDEWREKDSRIKVIHKQNEGVSVARNTGLEISKGDFIFFIDSDDYINNNYLLEKLMSVQKRYQCDIVKYTAIISTDINLNIDHYFNIE